MQMTVENQVRHFDAGEELEARRRLLLAELNRIESALKAYRAASISDFWQGLALDDLTVKEAMVAALEFADRAGKPEVTLGDLENLLKRYRLLTSRRSGGKTASEVKDGKGMFMLLVRVLTAPDNGAIFRYERKGDHASRNDKISLIGKSGGKPLK